MIDRIAGYRLTLRGEGMMLQQMHALGRYLKNAGVTAIFVDETRNVTGEFQATMENISYLADNIVFLRHLEVHGEMRKAIGVLKKRTSDFERTIREFQITSHGLKVGEPMSGMRGILSGTPEVVDDDRERQRRGVDPRARTAERPVSPTVTSGATPVPPEDGTPRSGSVPVAALFVGVDHRLAGRLRHHPPVGVFPLAVQLRPLEQPVEEHGEPGDLGVRLAFTPTLKSARSYSAHGTFSPPTTIRRPSPLGSTRERLPPRLGRARRTS